MRHEPDNNPPHWPEWYRNGERIFNNRTPPCEEAMKADTPKEYRLIELRANNFMKLKAVQVGIDGALLTVNGRNEQGKSAVLNAVAAAIGGPKAFPDKPIRKGEDRAEIFLDFGGLKLTRKIWNKEGGGVDHSLLFEYADGKRPKEKQTVLDTLRGSPIADDPIEFSRMEPSKRFKLMTGLVPDFDFDDHAAKDRDLREERAQVGREHKRAVGAAEAIQVPANAAKSLVDVTELLAEITEATETNAVIDRRRQRREDAAEALEEARDKADRMRKELKQLEASIADMEKKLQDAEALPEKIDVSALQEKIANAETINAGARKRQEKQQREAEADAKKAEYEKLTTAIEAHEQAKNDAIAAARFPVPELTFGDNNILLDGLPFDQASTARKIRVSTSLLMALKPELRVLLVREGSLLDQDARAALEAAAIENNFVVLMECVGEGDGSGITIEDGEVVS